MSLSATLDIGRINRLEIYKSSRHGLFLRAADGSEVLLPGAYVKPEMKEKREIEVFLYHDSDDRPVATTERPLAMLGEYAVFEVVDYRRYGAFVDWGLPKDLFVPLSQQKEYFRIGEKKVLRVCMDEKTGRLYATQKFGKYFLRDMSGLRAGLKMGIIVIAKTPMGYKVIADNRYEGMLFGNDTFEKLDIGEYRDAYITKVRADRKLDMSLRPAGRDDKVSEASERIVERLVSAGGRLDVTYKTRPDEIQDLFGLSRKIFKAALTSLIRENKVMETEGGIALCNSPE